MAKPKQLASNTAPFLRRMRLLSDVRGAESSGFPLNLPAFANGLDVDFSRRVTILVGANGSGKSTLLEAIAAHCGFSLSGGTKNIAHRSSEHEYLSRHLRFSWCPKVTKGFFFRAETFHSLVDTVDQLSREPGGYQALAPYGGVSMRERSHGQSFMAVFENRLRDGGIYIVDEPEAALSPQMQVEFLKLLRKLDRGGQSQVVVATHSPLIMAYPDAALLEISDQGIRPIEFHETDHFKITRAFALNPDGFLDGIMMDADEEIERAISTG